MRPPRTATGPAKTLTRPRSAAAPLHAKPGAASAKPAQRPSRSPSSGISHPGAQRPGQTRPAFSHQSPAHQSPANQSPAHQNPANRGRNPTRLPVLPYPVFERTLADPGPVDAPDAPPDADSPADLSGSKLTWGSPQPLAQATGKFGPGLFLVERQAGDAWQPVYVGMSAAGVGVALRWILQAPAIMNVTPDLDSLRVSVAQVGFDSRTTPGRAALRRLRDEAAQSFEQKSGQQVLTGPGPAAAAVTAAVASK